MGNANGTTFTCSEIQDSNSAKAPNSQEINRSSSVNSLVSALSALDARIITLTNTSTSAIEALEKRLGTIDTTILDLAKKQDEIKTQLTALSAKVTTTHESIARTQRAILGAALGGEEAVNGTVVETAEPTAAPMTTPTFRAPTFAKGVRRQHHI